MRTVLLVLSLLLVPGCGIVGKSKRVSKAGETTPLKEASVAVEKTTTAVDGKTDTVVKLDAERDSKVKANVEHAKLTNMENPEGMPKTVVDGDLEVALGHLQDVQSDPIELAARERDKRLVEAGKADEARANYTKAAEQGRKDAEELARTQAELEIARSERDAALLRVRTATETLEKQLEANRIANDRRIQEIVDKERRALTRKLTWGLALGTVALLALGAFLAYSKFNAGEPIKALIAGGFWGGAAACCATFAWAINQLWFQQLVMWMLIGTGVIGLGALTIYVIAELRSAREKRASTTEAVEAEQTLQQIMAVVDTAKPETTLEQLKTMFSNRMDGRNKALIHELRAEQQRAKAVKA